MLTVFMCCRSIRSSLQRARVCLCLCLCLCVCGSGPHPCVCVCVCVCVCARARQLLDRPGRPHCGVERCAAPPVSCIRMYTHTSVRTYVRTYVPTYLHSFICGFMPHATAARPEPAMRHLPPPGPAGSRPGPRDAVCVRVCGVLRSAHARPPPPPSLSYIAGEYVKYNNN